ncbi:flavoprotein-like protein [Blastocladiella britannica]|nr:flavoprotein-like protein [Blastocladiella britannica]
MTKSANIAIVIYSTYGHITTLAEAVKKGADATGHATATIYQVPETLSAEVLAKIYAPAKPDYPIATPDTLAEADAIIFGFPTRFGTFPAQIKSFLDSTGGLWAKGALVGKPTAVFTSTANQSGGQETTILSLLPFLAHHGLVFVPFGPSSPHLGAVDEVVGGSAWGAGTVATGTGARLPSDREKEIAETQGKNFATFAAKLVNTTI